MKAKMCAINLYLLPILGLNRNVLQCISIIRIYHKAEPKYYPEADSPHVVRWYVHGVHIRDEHIRRVNGTP